VTAPNPALELTAKTLARVARSSAPALCIAIHGVTSAVSRESAEFPTAVKEVLAMFGQRPSPGFSSGAYAGKRSRCRRCAAPLAKNSWMT
jgi:hypothetical protein